MTWKLLTGTTHTLDRDGRRVRLIVERDAYLNEPKGTKFCVSGEDCERSIHDSLEEAQKAAEASLA